LGEIIVLYDSDVRLSDSVTLNLIRYLNHDSKVGLVASNPLPLPSKSLAGYASFYIGQWLNMLRNSEAVSQYTVCGRGLAIRKDIAKTLILPSKVIAIDLYLTYEILRRGDDVAFADDAIVYFKPVETFKEFISQGLRAYIGLKQLENLTEKSRINHITLTKQILMAIKVAEKYLKEASATIVAYALLPIYLPKVMKGANSSIWDIAWSSKTLNTCPKK